ncbi:olfactory receptor 6C74-like [Lates calcarifer]|uniref:Olfactory receptor 6C74-like n=1 Tax=Lates calcarifer TaxID=8187 RepID=A0AAJ7QN07_LATCA|nr:olfactory receptor 6C74-like [Lates calcarifer]
MSYDRYAAICYPLLYNTYMSSCKIAIMNSVAWIFNIFGLISCFGVIICPLSLIFYSYMKILKVCFSGSKQTRQKAVSTCTPHLVVVSISYGSDPL